MPAGTDQRRDPSAAPSPSDRRRGTRHGVPAGVACFISSSHGLLIPATALDLSAKGVGVLAETVLTSGELISVSMSRGRTAAPIFRVVQVCHCTEQPGGFYIIGGRFLNALSPADLATLLDE
jgi:hypothetical protein